MFLKTLETGADVAENNTNLVTIGITPDYPETGYGYIKVRPTQNRGTGLCCRKICGKAEPRSCQRIFIHRRISLEQRHVYLEGLFYIKKHAEIYA